MRMPGTDSLRPMLLPVVWMPEVAPGDVLADLIAGRIDLVDGDVVVVTQKIVSKAEGRLAPVDPADPAGGRGTGWWQLATSLD